MREQTITLLIGTPGTVDFLSADYTLPASYSQDDYAAAMNDLRSRWDNGERGDASAAYCEGYGDGMEMAAYLKGFSDGLKG